MVGLSLLLFGHGGSSAMKFTTKNSYDKYLELRNQAFECTDPIQKAKLLAKSRVVLGDLQPLFDDRERS